VPRQRFFNLAPGARARLLRLATKQFVERGFEGASLNEILADAGISKGAYYYYFEDKEDLFATTLESALDDFFAHAPVPSFEGVSREEFWPTVARFVEQWAQISESYVELFQVVWRLDEGVLRGPRFAPILSRGHDLYRTVIEPGRRLGCVRTDLPVETLVRLLAANDMALDRIFMAAQTKVTPAALRKHVRLVFDTFQRLLVVAPQTNGQRRA
jgi:AcrR family transcriptional regulator